MARDRGMRNANAQGRERLHKLGATAVRLTPCAFQNGGPKVTDHMDDVCPLLETHLQVRDLIGAMLVGVVGKEGGRGWL